MLLWRTALFFVLVALAAALDLVDNSGCVSEGMECDSTEECCSGGMSTLCSSGKCRCWGGMQWRASIRRCVPIYSFGRFDPGGDDYDLHPHEEYVPPPVVPTWKPEPRTTQTSSEGVELAVQQQQHGSRVSGGFQSRLFRL
ncbi:unnamed protein product [Notodromas monacha]|uniref:Uncharacterized protein n=1 Tax=Notodromas monacha TaxID=399045 RepID=A0A7R9BTB7_9CRUS|nr:unnamed protein product [Notodromas monacha]CAG0921026.1 unnamed protein product [Notodromas monacha]